MSAIIAKNNYIGHGGCKRMNCAQSVVSAFKEAYEIDDDLIDTFKAYGSGKAPGGLCGAYYAVKSILERNNEDKAKELEQHFMQHAGALECSSIKSLKRLSCVGCVEKSSEFLEKLG